MTLRRRALAERRKTVGHTQEQLAYLLGVERTTVGRWEAGVGEALAEGGEVRPIADSHALAVNSVNSFGAAQQWRHDFVTAAASAPMTTSATTERTSTPSSLQNR